MKTTLSGSDFSYDQIFWNEYECVVIGAFLPFEKKPSPDNIVIKLVSIKDDLPLDVSDLSEDQILFFKEQVIQRWDLIRYRERFHS